jgi:hypothetical protein
MIHVLLGRTSCSSCYHWTCTNHMMMSTGFTLCFIITLEWALVGTYHSSLPHHKQKIQAWRFLVLNVLVAFIMLILAKTVKSLPKQVLALCIPNAQTWLEEGTDLNQRARTFIFKSVLWLACFIQAFLFCNLWLDLDSWVMHAGRTKTSPVDSLFQVYI